MDVAKNSKSARIIPVATILFKIATFVVYDGYFYTGKECFSYIFHIFADDIITEKIL